MKVFLTGATGYIGGAIAEALQTAGHSVTGLARTPAADRDLRAAGVTPHRADLKAPESLTTPVAACDAVIHAGTTNDGRADTDAIAHMLAQMEHSGKPFLYTSGIWVIGDTGGKVVDESAPYHPPPLVAWRPGVEQLVLSTAPHGVRAVVLRPAIVHGRGDGIPAGFVESARESGAARHVGDGQNHWPLVHVEDLAALYVRALESAPAGALYFAADGPAYRVREIAEAAAFGAGAEGRTEAWPLEEARQVLGPYADALVLDQQVSGEKARRELRWKPRAASLLDDLRNGSYAQPPAKPPAV